MGKAGADPLERSPSVSRVVVIGAGIGGMCAAARLAALGHKVELFESSDQVGGKCRTEWIGNTGFDTGPSLMTLPAVYRDFFLKTGAPMEDVLTLEPVNPSFDYQFADGSNVEFANLSRFDTLDAITKSFGSSAANDWSKLMVRASSMWDASRKSFIESELTSLSALLRKPTVLRDISTIAPWKSLRSLVSSTTSDRRLQYIANRYATYSGSDPRKAPAVLLSIAYIEEVFGAWHIAGGMGQLAKAIHLRALETGVTFHLNSKVQRILHKDLQVTGIELTGGDRVNADLVIANADASQVYSTLITDNLRVLKQPRKLLKKADPSVAGFSLMLGMKRDSNYEQLAHHTILFPKNYYDEFESIFARNQPAVDPCIYICAPTDPRMNGDKEIQGWTVLVNAPRHSKDGNGWDWSEKNFANEYAANIIDRIEARGIVIRDRLKFSEIRTPADLEAKVLAPGGSIYGTSSNGARAAFLRARNRSPLNGLFCVGGSAHPGGGLPLVAISAEIVSKLIGKA